MSDLLESISFENPFSFLRMALLFALAVVGIYWEFRKQKPRKEIRIFALLVVLMSLYFIYLSPYTTVKKTLKSALIISKTISESTIDSLVRDYNYPIFREDSIGRLVSQENEKANLIENATFQIDTAFVYGYLPQLNPAYYQVRKDIEIKKGIRLHYSTSIALGDSLIIGIRNLEENDMNISAILSQDTLIKFLPKKEKVNVATLPKSDGHVLTKISTDDANYNFAVSVERSERYVIQILSASPDFEWRFFRDYLKSKEHSVYQKTQISKDKFKSAFVNWHDTLQINRGVANDLKVLFIDAKAWEDLSFKTKDRYLKKLTENKGSLIFRTNPNTKIQADLGMSKSTNIFSTGDNMVELDDYKYLQFNALKSLDEVEKNVVFRQVLPNLIFGVINFQNSFQLKLSGKNEIYVEIWTQVFRDLVRKTEDVFFDKTDWAVQYQPFFFRAWSTEKMETISIINSKEDTFLIPSKSDLLFPERQHFMFYPKDEGWHFVQLKNADLTIPFYVHSEQEAVNSEFLSNYNYDYSKYLTFDHSNDERKNQSYNRKPVTIWFFVLFIMSVAYLWIEDKFT